MVIAPKSIDTNLSELLSDANNGTIQLPEFQRSWTWDDARIRNILASLSQGYPMGAIMCLQYGNPDIKFKYYCTCIISELIWRLQWQKRFIPTIQQEHLHMSFG
ncbi:MAG: DUF262 domain-containing protein [Synergistaceae bacterium]|nr:DUF262 domain-containing protein [Synergistaceae bacterium]